MNRHSYPETFFFSFWRGIRHVELKTMKEEKKRNKKAREEAAKVPPPPHCAACPRAGRICVYAHILCLRAVLCGGRCSNRALEGLGFRV